MDPEEKEKLDRIEHLTEENHEILEKLHRYEKRRIILRIFYWAAIVALSLGAYYLVQPYFEALKELTGNGINFEQLFKGFGG